MTKTQLKLIARSNIYQLYKQERYDIFDVMQQYKKDLLRAGLSIDEFLECHDYAAAAYNKDHEQGLL
jgi:hypothetical protein